MNLNVTRDIDDFSPAVLLELSLRIAKSRTAEQLICRESELDELWRLLDFAVADAHRSGSVPVQIAHLERLRAMVIEAHDLIGVEGNVAAAAERLNDSKLDARSNIDVITPSPS